DHIRYDIPGRAASADPNSEGDGRVVVRAGDMATGKDHDHEHRANGKRSHAKVNQDGAADGQNQKKRADEFLDVPVHDGFACIGMSDPVSDRCQYTNGKVRRKGWFSPGDRSVAARTRKTAPAGKIISGSPSAGH